MRATSLIALSLLISIACRSDDKAEADSGGLTAEVDGDGDGYTESDDCDDDDAAISPDAIELCDGIDNDCDGDIDEGATTTFYVDADADGYGDSGSPVEACDAPDGTVSDDTDCDDLEGAVNPGAVEVCNDVDDDCDGLIDDDDADLDTSTGSSWYADADVDGCGDPSAVTLACIQPDGMVPDNTDCDDTDGAVNPVATEICNGIDDDCDGAIDDDDADLDTSTADTWYADADSDGYGDASTTSLACLQPSGSVSDLTDCDDSDGAVNPGATEVCNDLDDDCDGLIDDDDSGLDTTTADTWYADSDSDGYGDASVTSLACDQLDGTVADKSDCDDSDGAIHPAATEVCNSVDDDCDGRVDDADTDLDMSTATTWYADTDLDGYGDADDSAVSCDEPSGYVSDDTDCDDDDVDINPGATEACNAVDDDCDGTIDNGASCPCTSDSYGGHAYLFCDSSEEWSDASTSCDSYGYILASVTSSAENTWVYDTAVAVVSAEWWIGLHDQDTEGSFEWESGESLSYTNWGSSQPDDGSGSEDCVHYGYGGAYYWNDDQCWNTKRYVCESE